MSGWARRCTLLGLASVIALVGAVPLSLWAAVRGYIFLHTEATPLVADRVVVLKRRGLILLMRDGVVRRRFPIALGFQPAGHKRREGDGRTPEGVYDLDWRWNSPRHGPSIHISYPSAADKRRANRAGDDPGGAIMLHGLRGSLPWIDTDPEKRKWTAGCIGLRPADMKVVWRAAPDGTPIEIRP